MNFIKMLKNSFKRTPESKLLKAEPAGIILIGYDKDADNYISRTILPDEWKDMEKEKRDYNFEGFLRVALHELAIKFGEYHFNSDGTNDEFIKYVFTDASFSRELEKHIKEHIEKEYNEFYLMWRK